ncbi:hypothetical protein FDG96_gp44 [Bacillus phage Mgbh1]|uniref:Uncharacterized protein n=1 Tax=Bacillus phage Mgbh1 TaxID=1796993 RepID=A0A142F1P6_9CAUD|nr:hypothetical protein FDG96_gp44 [Bacillus phage Mgbh1]AMQ66703.1 hypothetical protein [Bacillus phage Mgbh1]
METNRLTDGELAEIKRRAERSSENYRADAENDAEFIAHANEDVSRLIAEVEWLRGAVWFAVHHLSNEIYTEEDRVKDVQEALLRCVWDTVNCPECRADILVKPNWHGRCDCGSHVKFG